MISRTTKIRSFKRTKSSHQPTPKYPISIKLWMLSIQELITASRKLYISVNRRSIIYWNQAPIYWEFLITSLLLLIILNLKGSRSTRLLSISHLIKAIWSFVLSTKIVPDFVIWKYLEMWKHAINAKWRKWQIITRLST